MQAAAIQKRVKTILLCALGFANCGMIAAPNAPVATGIAANNPAFDELKFFSTKKHLVKRLVWPRLGQTGTT